jgi:nucleotide-binding universal stress UspA family protein
MDQLEAEARDRLRTLLSARAFVGPTVVTSVRGDAGHEILKYAADHQIDLIVCGTHGRTGWEHVMMGSVAERLVRLAVCPVLTVHETREQKAAA